MQKIKLIVCYQKDGGIGLGLLLLYISKELPGDMRRFMALRKNCVIIVGRITWETLRKHPLPDCINVVVSGRNEFEHDEDADKISSSLSEAIAWAQKMHPDKDIAIIGGEKIYNEALQLNVVDIVHATVVDGERPADKFFPELSPDIFSVVFEEEQIPGESGIKFCFKDYKRKEVETEKEYHFFSPPKGPSKDTYGGGAD